MSFWKGQSIQLILVVSASARTAFRSVSAVGTGMDVHTVDGAAPVDAKDARLDKLSEALDHRFNAIGRPHVGWSVPALALSW